MASIDRSNVEDILNLTPMQEGLLYHFLKEGRESSQNFEQICLQMNGCLNMDLFMEAWDVVVQKNEMLRTVFRWKKLEQPVQIVLKTCVPAIELFDLSDVPADKKSVRFEEIKQKDKVQLFDLEDIPFRINVVKFNNYQFTQIISNHSIIYDGWSNGIILKEFFQVYQSLLRAAPFTLTGKQPFKEFVKIARNNDSGNAKLFWEQYLSGRADDISFPKKNNSGSFVGKTLKSSLPEKLVNDIEAFCVGNKITKATLFYSVWGILLQKITVKKDVIFGTTVSGRSAKIRGIENMVGLLINTLPLRVINKGQTVYELLSEISPHLKKREDHENTPLLKIKEYGQFQSAEEIFDTIVLIENYPLDLDIFKNDPLCSIAGFTFDQTNNFDLAVSILNIDTGIDIFFGYNATKYSEVTIHQYAKYFSKIASEIVRYPQKDISKISLLDDDQQKIITCDWNQTTSSYSGSLSIHHLFGQRATEAPHKMALVFSGQHFTYGMLDQLSDQLAYELRQRFGCNNIVIPVVMGRSAEMIVTLLAILKAGFAYVPLEPFLPEARIEKMLTGLAASCILTDNASRALSEKIAARSGGMEEVLCILSPDVAVPLDSVFNRITYFTLGNGPGNDAIDTSSQKNTDIAYIIYTSGSTGTPKGVVVQHKPVINIIEWINKTLGVCGDDKLLFVTSIGFDLSVYDIFGSFAAGATICMASGDELADARGLLRKIANEQITIWDSAPAAFQQIVQVGNISGANFKNNKLRLVLLSGDWIGLQLPDQAKKLFNNTRIVSLGGATEAVIWSNYFFFDKVEAHWTSIPYGKPIQNAKYYILDDDLNVLPQGIVGELYIGGQCLAAGYLNDIELTRQRFIGNPFCEGERIYRTGDLARWMDDGNIGLLGRRDHQVKIRGFRIELGEIESRLIKFPGIENISVFFHKNLSGENYIAAFYESAEELYPGVIKDYLRKELPDYMVPAFVIGVDKIPVTANGKVDRTALLLLINESGLSKEKDLPQTQTEIGLANIWAEILHRDPQDISCTADFFEMGGHSLTATILQARIEKKFDTGLSLREIFLYPDLSQMANQIDSGVSQKNEIIALDFANDYPVTSGQKRLYSLQLLNKNTTNFNIAGCLKISGKFDVDKFANVIKQIIKTQEVLRTSFFNIDGSVRQRIHNDINFHIQHIKLSVLEEPLNLQKYMRAFNLAVPPLFNITLFETANNVHYLLLDIHHIISDGLSIHNFIVDFVNGYSGKDIMPPAITFKDYSSWTLSEPFLKKTNRQQAFWLSQFNHGLTRLNLPLDFERPANKTYEGDHLIFDIDDYLIEGIQALVKATNSTLFIVILSFFNVALSKICRQADVTLGIPVANRPNADLHRVMGFFVNTLALYAYVDEQLSFISFVDRVKTNTIDAFDNQDYPFEYLASELEGRRDPRFNPVFDVALDFDNLDLPEIQLPGLTTEIIHNVFKRADFDLVLKVSPAKKTMTFKLEYNTNLFNSGTIKWMRNSLLNVFRTVVPNSHVLIKDIDIFKRADKPADSIIQFEF